MPFIKVGRENSGDIQLYYEDHGSGAPVVLIHGYLLDGHSWEKQETALLSAGCRVVTYDRRGFGNSSRPSAGYDFDTLSADLSILLTELDLRQVTLVGFGMGTGEVIRYLAAYGTLRVRRAALLAPLPPFLLRTADNPLGVGCGIFDELLADFTADRPAATKAFIDNSYNIDLLGGSQVSDQAWQNSFYVAIRASARAAVGCLTSWREDFRDDLARITVPVLIVQGSQDRIMPPEATGNRLPALLGDVRHIVVGGGPHAITWTHASLVNQALLDFVALGLTDPMPAVVPGSVQS
jgi:non-heme chloroperoxidase